MADEHERSPGTESRPVGAIVPQTLKRTTGPHAVIPEADELFSAEADAAGAPSTAVSASVLLRSKWLILGTFALLSAATVPWIWLFISPTYEATAMVRVSPVAPWIVEKDKNENAAGRFYDWFKNTESNSIGSTTIRQRVLDDPKVQATAWYREQPRTWRTLLGGVPPTRLERLASVLNVRAEPYTELINVSVRARVASDAATLVNAIVDEYERYTKESLREAEIVLKQTLAQERQERQDRLNALVDIKYEAGERLGTIDPEGLRRRMVEDLRELELDKGRLEDEQRLTQWELESYSSVVEEGKGAGSGTHEAVDDADRRYAADAEWRRLSIDLKEARYQLQRARQQYGESHPRIIDHLADVDLRLGLLSEREAQLDAYPGGSVYPVESVSTGPVVFLDRPTLKRLAAQQEKKLEFLQKRIDRLRAKIGRVSEIAKEIARYDEDIRLGREMLDAVRSRKERLEMESKAPGRISVQARAVAPSQPSRDRRFLLTIMALGGAMMTGLVIAIVRTSVNPKIWEPGDVRHTLRAPFLGQLPAFPPGVSLAGDGGPLITEGMRMVRTALLERFSGTDKRTVLITSASSRAGKTSVALELAKSLAYLGKKTLLVEADLCRPALSEHLGIKPAAGLAALLNGVATESEVIVSSDVPKLDVLLAGEQVAEFNPELLANGVFGGCLSQWRRTYDFVLLDSPPVLPVADSRILAGQVDGTVMVLRASHCRRADVTQAYADLSAAGGTLLGTVLVGVRQEPRYGYSYTNHGENGRPAALPAG